MVAKTVTKPGDHKDPNAPDCVDLVKADLDIRREQGQKKYGVTLKPFDGNQALVEVYQEMLDAVLYLRQEIYEREKVQDAYTYQLVHDLTKVAMKHFPLQHDELIGKAIRWLNDRGPKAK